MSARQIQYGVYVPTSAPYDAGRIAGLAVEAEQAGWDGFFVWDNVLATFDGRGLLSDSTVVLALIADRTERLRFGTLVTPLPRRRPWKFAKELSTLDHVSGGRVIAGVGLGGYWDTWPVGDEEDLRRRAAMLDEGLEVVTRLWQGDDTHFEGEHYTLRGARMLPRPLQQPRIPIWLGGHWPNRAPFRRAAAWDGIAPVRRNAVFEGLDPLELRACAEYVRAHRRDALPFDVVHFQLPEVRSADLVAEYVDAGATWWLESASPFDRGCEAFQARVRRGPPTT